MLPLPRISCLALGLAAGWFVLANSSFAGEPVRQKFGGWTVTIQPGVRNASPREFPNHPIRLISYQQEAPADAVEAFPPQPSAPETPAVPEKTEAPAATEAPSAPQSPDETPAVHIPGTTPPGVPASLELARLYSQVYNTIPFSRAEYTANPSYRHDATMEFLFGQMRPTVIQRGTTVIKQRPSVMPYGYPAYSPYGFNSYSYPFYNRGINWLYDLW